MKAADDILLKIFIIQSERPEVSMKMSLLLGALACSFSLSAAAPVFTPEKFLQEIQHFDYLLLGSGEKNVDLQESELEIRRKLHALTAAALGNGGLELVFSGKTCHLLKIKRLTKR